MPYTIEFNPVSNTATRLFFVLSEELKLAQYNGRQEKELTPDEVHDAWHELEVLAFWDMRRQFRLGLIKQKEKYEIEHGQNN